MLSIAEEGHVETLKGRKVGCLVADGTDLEAVKSLKAAVKSAWARTSL